MSYNKTLAASYGRLLILSTVFLTLFLCGPLKAEEVAKPTPDQPLTEADVESLESSLQELKALAPKLRVLLRTLRSQAGFEPRQVHLIERGLSQSQKDLERLIAMNKRKAFNGMRAHFLADDLRRKSQGLKDSLAYVSERAQVSDLPVGDDNQRNAAQKQNNETLLSLLGRYSELVSDNVALLQERGI